MRLYFILFIALLCQSSINAQSNPLEMQKDTLPYYEIPAYPDSFGANQVVSRMIDGLGFRYYWATEGLRAEDLAYKPNTDARSSEETIDHIMGLATMILNAVTHQPNVRTGEETSALSFDTKRRQTLLHLKAASDILRSGSDQLENYPVIFKNGEKTTEFPFWNLINGPIADALWHTGQVVSFRRASGNPFNGKVNVFTGKLRE